MTPGLPSELLTQRPDIRRQENQLASATANVGSARAQFFPSIQLTGQGGYQSAALAAAVHPQSAFFNVAAGLTQPIFDAGRIQANFELQKAVQDELLQTYRKTVISAFADVDTALATLKQANERLRLQRIVVASSRRAFELSERQLRAGTVGHRDCAKHSIDAIPGGRFADAGATRSASGRGQPLPGIRWRLVAKDGAGRCSLNPS